jgi:very-short-patch-repair endonuclease
LNSINGRKNGKISAASRKLRSKNEIKLFDICSSYYSNVVSNHIISDGWGADIAFIDFKVCVFWNGPWHYRDMGIKNVSLKQIQNRDNVKTKLFESLGWNVISFRDDEYTPVAAFNHLKGVLNG